MLRMLQWLMLSAPYLLGLFFPWTSAVISVMLAGMLLAMLKTKHLCFTKSPAFLASAGLVLFLLLGVLWGTDRGMALVGAVQFLPLPLFTLVLEQYSPEQRETVFPWIVYGAGVMVLASLLLSRIFPREGWFLVSGRQAGFFQYPNTYALYLLCAVVLVLFGKSPRFGVTPWLAVFGLGIALSGSRTVFILLAGVLLLAFLLEKNHARRIRIAGLFGLIILAGIVYVATTGNRDTIGRFMTISLSASEWLGRLLYAKDALPIILKHPFGIGYMGYYWLQGSFQTGVYSVRHMHNDLFQLLLDAGWIPAALFVWAIFRGFFSKRSSLCRRVLIAVIVLHALLDFDLQFVSIALLLLLAADVEPRAGCVIRQRAVAAGLLALCMGVSVWIGTASAFSYFRKNAAAAKIYPAYTTALVGLLQEAPEEESGELANRILKLNPSVVGPYQIKARKAYANGDLDAYAEHRKTIIRLAKYSLPEYIDYAQGLRRAYETCLQRGDKGTAERCLGYLAEIPQMLEAVKQQTSRLGWMIKDQPMLSLPAEITEWINAHVHP